MATLEDWRTAGIDIKTELSTAGDLVLANTETDIALNSGGTNGVPAGATPYVSHGQAWTPVNSTTSVGSWKGSVVTPPGYAPYQWGFIFYVNGQAGKQYQLQLSQRLMAGRTDASLFIAIEGWNPNTLQYDMTNGGVLQDERPISDWRRMAATMTSPLRYSSGYTQLRITVAVGGINLNLGTTYNWGVEIADLTVVAYDSTLAPREWRDISCDVRGMTTRYGRERFTNRFDVASLALELLNDDGEYAYSESHPFGFGPGRIIRVTMTKDAVSYPFAFMLIDTISDGMSHDGHAITMLSCLDPSSIMSNRATPSLPMLGTGADERIQALLTFNGYPSAQLDNGVWRMQEIVASGRSLRDEAGITADSEGGSFYAERDGRMMYRNRNWLTNDPSLKQVTAQFDARPRRALDQQPWDGTTQVAGMPHIFPSRLVTDWTMARVVNYVELANTGGTVKVYEDKPSQRKHGPRTYQRHDFVLDDFYSGQGGWLDIRANDIMSGYTVPKMRLNQLTYKPGLNGNDWTWTLTAFLNWLVRVWYQNTLTGWGWYVITHIQSIEHRITPSDWEVTLSLDQPTYYADAPITDYAVWDTNAKWDTSYVWA